MRPIPVLLAAAMLAVPAAATAVPPPTVSGPSGPIREAPTYTIVSDALLPEYTWTVSGPEERSGSGTTAALGPLPDGPYVFSARQTVLLGGPPNPSEPATVAFTLDTLAPAPPALAAPASPTEDTTPRIAWAGEPGGRYTWRVTRDAVPVRGPVTTTELEAAIAPALAEGGYVLEVRQTDAAGNEGAPALAPFVVALPRPALGATGPAGPPPEPTAAAPTVGPSSPAAPRATKTSPRGTLFAERLSPANGRRVRTLRPVLRWLGRPAGTTLFNLQIFDGRRKVHSAFPRGNRYRVPPGILRHGRRYVWRVWPYRGRLGYAIRPLGVSVFTAPPAPRPRGAR